MSKLDALREEIDQVDDKLVKEFVERQNISEKIAETKKVENLGITDIKREQEVVENAISKVDTKHKKTTASFIRSLISLSKIRQNEELGLHSEIDFPKSSSSKNGKVVFQGISGSWSNLAAKKLFPNNDIYGSTFFEDVIEEIKSGNADYGILPIENSTSGAVGLTYDLLRANRLFIVKQIWIPVKQCLVSVKGAKEEQIRTILSHPQGFTQSSRYFKGKNLILTECQNTAIAAQKVSDLNDPTVAAIASKEAAEEYNLEVLNENIMNDQNNKTRFVVLSKEPEYDKNSDITSVAFTTQHRSGALSNVLQSFMLSDTNLRRIESRPGSSDLNFRFFCDLDGNIEDEKLRLALQDAAHQCEFFEVIGCFSDFSE